MSDMIPGGEYTAVLDRLEADQAALVLEEDGTDAYELVVDLEQLPPNGREPDAVLTVEISDGELVDAAFDPEATAARQDSAQRRFDRLSERPPSDDEGAN